MNERFAIDPKCFSSSFELRYLLEKFGPYTGRYGVHFPKDWRAKVTEHTRDWTEMEHKRVASVLERNKYAILRESLNYSQLLEWLDNVRREMVGISGLDGAVVREEWEDAACSLVSLSNLNLSPTADERIEARISEYQRVTRGLRSISPELVFVDPYLDLTNEKQRVVVEALLGRGQRNAYFWVQWDDRREYSKFEEALAEVKRKTGVEGELRLFVVGPKHFDSDQTLADRGSTRFHTRYLLSVRGGIRFDEGFREKKVGRQYRKVDMSIVGKESHESLWIEYGQREHGLRILNEYYVGKRS